MVLVLVLVLGIAAAVGFGLSTLRRSSSRGVTRIGLGVVAVLLAPCIYLIASAWFTFSLDIDATPGMRPRFDGGPWLVGCAGLAAVGVVLAISGAISRAGDSAVATSVPAD